MNEYNPLPNIETYSDGMNPMIMSPSSPYAISFYATRDSLLDTDVYRAFLKNIEKRVRQSVFYKHYKSHVYDYMDHSQIHANINSEMATLEMHHAIMTLFDIALMITEYFLNTVGYVTSYDVVQTIKDEHRQNNIALVMMDETSHQVYHANSNTFLIHPDMCISKNWPILLEKYHQGITQDLAFKILYYIKRSIESGCTDDQGLLDLRDKIQDWSGLQ